MMRLMSTKYVTATKLAALAVGYACLDHLISQAQASQGPGTLPGTASTTIKLAMAIVVYGGSAIVIAAGLIGAARQRRMRG